MFSLIRGLPADSAIGYVSTQRAKRGGGEIADLPEPDKREPEEGPRTRRVPMRSAAHLAETLRRSPALRGKGVT